MAFDDLRVMTTARFTADVEAEPSVPVCPSACLGSGG